MRDRTDNVLKRAPHTLAQVAANEWNRPYGRETRGVSGSLDPDAQILAFCWSYRRRLWRSELVCACPPIEAYRRPHRR